MKIAKEKLIKLLFHREIVFRGNNTKPWKLVTPPPQPSHAHFKEVVGRASTWWRWEWGRGVPVLDRMLLKDGRARGGPNSGGAQTRPRSQGVVGHNVGVVGGRFSAIRACAPVTSRVATTYSTTTPQWPHVGPPPALNRRRYLGKNNRGNRPPSLTKPEAR